MSNKLAFPFALLTGFKFLGVEIVIFSEVFYRKPLHDKSIEKIILGDLFLATNNTDKLIAIKYLEGNQETFTISELRTGNNFIANGFVVAVEKLKSKENLLTY